MRKLPAKKYALIVPRGRIEDPSTPKIKIFNFVFVADGCLSPL